MSQVLISNMDETILQRLRERAARTGRSVEAEVMCILAEALRPAAGTPLNPEAIAAIRATHDELAATGRTFSDSTEYLREVRNR